MGVNDSNQPNFREANIPLVSILVPSYNHQKYVIECLESIFNLDYPRLELLISDDRSQDATFQLAEQWVQNHQQRFERTQVVRQQTNLGIVGNIQYLFDEARGDYLAPIASDDMFLPTALTERVEFLQKNCDLDAIFGNSQYISESGDVICDQFISRRIARIFFRLSSRKLLAAGIVLNWLAPGPGILLRRDATCERGSLGRLPKGLGVEDVHIYLRLAALGKLAFINSVVAKYRRTGGSLTDKLFESNTGQEALVQGYRMNTSLMTGFNRIVLENRLSRYSLQMGGKRSVFHSLRSFWLRIITAQLKFTLYILTAFPRYPKFLG